MSGPDEEEVITSESDVNQLYPGDRFWVTVERNAPKRSNCLFAKNPFKAGPGHIYAKNTTDASPGEEVLVEIDEIPGHIQATIIEHKNRADNEGEDTFSGNCRDEPILWRGSEQTIDEEQTKRRNEVFSQGDSRGDKNDLLDGHI